MVAPKYAFIIIAFSVFVIGIGAFLIIENTPSKSRISTLFSSDNPVVLESLENETPVDFDEERLRWGKRINEVGAEAAYEEFKKEYSSFSFGAQHLGAHVVGELLYREAGIAGIKICDVSFAFGCYHSFFAAALSEEGMEVVLELDRVCSETYGPLGTGCYHGIGHGILEYLGHKQLLLALETCEMTSQPHPLFGCTAGVFMEYNMQLVVTVDSAFIQMRELKKDNPYQPCNTFIPERFKDSCYYELTQWWSTKGVVGLDYTTQGRLCGKVKEPSYQEVCFLGIGNNIAFFNDYTVDKTVLACGTMPTLEAELLCRAGASWSFFASETARDRAPELCVGLDLKGELECLRRSDIINS